MRLGLLGDNLNLLVKCPKCGRQVQVPDSSTGQVILCPGCEQFLKVPDQGSPDGVEEQLSESLSAQEPPIWRNPATYIALGTVAALGAVLLVVFLDKPEAYMSAGPKLPPQDPSLQVQPKSHGTKPNTPKAPAAPEPARGTASRVEYEIKQALGTSNRKVPRVLRIEAVGPTIRVNFSINDNLTGGFIKSGAKIDVGRILKALHRSGYDYSVVIMVGTFSLADKFGNSSEENVLRVIYYSHTVNRINWENFLWEDMYSIADDVWLHPAFR